MFAVKPLATNFTLVGLNGSEFWFSYSTCICFRHEGRCYQAASDRNGEKWSKTTKGHLNQCPKADEVLEWAAFERMATLASGAD